MFTDSLTLETARRSTSEKDKAVGYFHMLSDDRRLMDHLHFYSYEVDGPTMKERLVHPASRLPFPHDSPSDTAKTVLLLAWVNCDGSVLETDYLSGPPELFKPADDAVKKWKYHPIVYNGTPMEVRTTVTVVFGPGE